MLISGEWFFFPDQIVRPVIRGEILYASSAWIPVTFLLDTGADRTVLTATVLSSLALQSEKADEPIGGLGGVVDSAIVETRIQFIRETGSPVSFRGRFAA